jgi:hypothetical protein
MLSGRRGGRAPQAQPQTHIDVSMLGRLSLVGGGTLEQPNSIMLVSNLQGKCSRTWKATSGTRLKGYQEQKLNISAVCVIQGTSPIDQPQPMLGDHDLSYIWAAEMEGRGPG